MTPAQKVAFAARMKAARSVKDGQGTNPAPASTSPMGSCAKCKKPIVRGSHSC